jgi:chromosome segregation ATPase
MTKRGMVIGFIVGMVVIGLALGMQASTGAAGLGPREASPTLMPELLTELKTIRAELLTELKLLRAAVQDSARRQSQLSAQQDLIARISASIDASYTQLAVADGRSREAAVELAGTLALVARTPDPNQRAMLDARIPGLKQLSSELANEVSQIQSRIARLTASFTTEEQRWQALLTR